MTEIYDYLRLLYARVGHQHCPQCGREVSRQTIQQIVDAVLGLPDGSRLMLLAPLVQGRKGEYKNIFEEMRRSGYVRVRVDGEIHDLSEEIELDKQKKHTIEVVVDRLVLRKRKPASADDASSDITNNHASLRKVAERPALYDVNAISDDAREAQLTEEIRSEVDPAFRQRLADSLETTLKLGSGVVLVSVIDGEEILFSEKAACVYCGISLPEIAPRTFSFNSPHGACPDCTGLGTQQEFDPDLIVAHPELSLAQGASDVLVKMLNHSSWFTTTLHALTEHQHFSLETPWKELSEEVRHTVLYGTKEDLTFRYTAQYNGGTKTYHAPFEGIIPYLNKRYKETSSAWIREELEGYMSARLCPTCRGARLRPEALAVTVGGRNIVQVSDLSIGRAERFFTELEIENPAIAPITPTLQVVAQASGKGKKKSKSSDEPVAADPLIPIDLNGPLVLSTLSERERLIARQVLKEIRARLQFLLDDDQRVAAID